MITASCLCQTALVGLRDNHSPAELATLKPQADASLKKAMLGQ
ncbi:MAG: hypothetical protein PHT48_12295 [Dechloromonas sp.]|nr:hypothetical protein [Dechloromonas sp.]